MTYTDGIELRLAQYIQYRTGGRKSEFAARLGWSKQYLNTLLRGKSIGLAPVAALLRTFPDLNARWLLFGEGTMTTYASDAIRRHMHALLTLDRYLAVMTPEELRTVEAGKYEWDEEHIARWEALAAKEQ
ncbi:MAG: hypothetical protein NC344_09720 [Bacteroidales bacterium]|nr:hypothetical protein [Bacteroidales bacterium]MCM1148082.1 hypothetical protein [Bacteroidales bacterium]MCM1509462.1 hypothetical protein [Clostridium sp.]